MVTKKVFSTFYRKKINQKKIKKNKNQKKGEN